MYSVGLWDHLNLAIPLLKHLIREKYRSTEVQKYRSTEVQTYRRTDVQTFRRTDGQTYRRTDVQTYRRTDVQTYRSTEVQKYRSTEVQKYRSTEVQKYLLHRNAWNLDAGFPISKFRPFCQRLRLSKIKITLTLFINNTYMQYCGSRSTQWNRETDPVWIRVAH